MTLLIKALSYGARLLPTRFLLWMGRFFGLIWFYVIPIRRKVVLGNLKLAFGSSLSKTQRWVMARKNYEHYGMCLVEILLSATWKKKDFQQKVKVHGFEHIEPVLKAGQGAFMLSLHLGNWEILIGSGAHSGIKPDVVVKTQQSRSLQAFLENYRQGMEVGVLYESDSARAILKSLRQGRQVAFVNDQFMGPPVGIEVDFFGQPAGTAVAIAVLTEKRDVPVFPIYSYRDKNYMLNTVIEKPLEFDPMPQEKTARLYHKMKVINLHLESLVRKHPEQWLWLHRRWKPFRGKPRWELPSSLAAIFLSLWIAGCASTSSPENEIVKVELPPEPVVSLPDFGEKQTSFESPVVVKELQEGRQTARSQSSPQTKPEVTEEKKFSLKSFAPELIPFEVGERQVLSLNWLAVPAGEVVLDVKKGPVFQNRETFKLSGSIKSNTVVSLMYRVENYISSIVDKQALIPYKFTLLMDEKLQYKYTRVNFDHQRALAHYMADRKSERWGDQKDRRQDALEIGTQDMFSALYYVRTLEYEMGKTVSFYAFENGKNYEVKLTPVKKEVLSTSAGTFQCWKLKVNVALNNTLKPMGDVYMWLSDDSKKYLVRFEAEIKIGAIIGSLTEIKEGV